MAAIGIRTFADVVSAVMEQLGVQSSDTTAKNKIKRAINMIYDEVITAKRWRWLEKETSVMHDVYFSDNTNYSTVTNDSTTVTLNVAPSAALGSFLGHKYAVDGFPEVYEITAHTAGGTAITLNAGYLGVTSAVAGFKIWRDKIDLPVDCKETVDVSHARHTRKMKGVGTQELREILNGNPKQEGYPAYFNQTDFYDPTPSDAETESDRYRRLEIYPAVTLNPVTINIKYIQEVDRLDVDADEPVMPMQDRAVLVDGALSICWITIARDPEMAAISSTRYNSKLSRMIGEIEEGFDQPVIAGKSRYLNAIRHRGLNRKNMSMLTNAGQSSYNSPTYAKDIVLEGGNITANFTVVDGVTIDGRDISEDGEALDEFLSGTEVTLTDNTTNQVVAEWAVATYDVVHIDYSLKRSTAYEAGSIKIITNGTSAAISDGGIATLADPGVTFSVDVSGSNVRLLSTTTSTGNTAAMQYTETKWKA